MTGYVRPDIPAREFWDSAGRIIPYGDRWGFERTPDDAYSVTSNLERFAPLHDVAEALIAHLEETYDVTVYEDAAFARDILHSRDDVLRAVRVRPADAAAASLTFVFTSFPSVIVHAGEMHDFLYPVCGCDACDENWERTADDMEWQILAVPSGRYEERIERGRTLAVVMSLEAADGSAKIGAESGLGDFPAERLAAAGDRLTRLGDAWSAWPRRASLSQQ